MLFTQDAPLEQNAGRYYHSPDYISHSDTRKGLVNRIYHWVRSVMLGRKARLVMRESGREGGHLLDIGAGTGYFADKMRQCGFSVKAIEVDAGARATAMRNFGVAEEDASALAGYASSSFDVITMWHVLEHVYRLSDEWRTLYRLLKDDGRLVIAVPNCASADAAHYGRMWAAYDVPRHLWHFSPSTMKRMARQYGFRLVSMHAMPFDGFYISMLSEKNKGTRFPFLCGLIHGFAALMQALVNKGRSSSIIYVFEKLS